ncbi:MAG TPA: helix-turn-helix domain-containing protein [Terrimesophilobacter sp.]|nr:helix-turn-helix domain-containing protein [Terrimesophilobacter sp.]
MPADSVGARLREARTSHKLSLRNVAQALGVSASLISQVETGKTQPSVSTLFAMAHHFGLSLDELLDVKPSANRAGQSSERAALSAPTVQRASDNPVIEMENGVRWERLAAPAGGPAEALLVTYEPGASSSVEGKLMRHSGIEYAYILEGHLNLQLEFDLHELGPGDSLQFDAVRPHSYSNPGKTPARGVWFVAGRHQQNEDMPTAPGAATRPIGAPLSSAVDVLRAMDDLRS